MNGSRHPASLAQESWAAGRGWRVLRMEGLPGESPGDHARRTARHVLLALDEKKPQALVVFGGDTAFAILDALGRPPVHPLGELAPGIPISRAGALHRPLWLVTKAGGFGAPDVAATIKATLEKGS